MISSKNLADAICQLSETSKKGDDAIVNSFLEYVKEYRLEPLLPKVIMFLEDIIYKKTKWDTLEINSSIEISNEIKIKIQEKLNATDLKNITSKVDENLIGGFVATHKGVIYDASIKNQLQLLRNALTK